MTFARKVWKLLVGIKDGLVLLLMLLFFAALFAALSYRPTPATVEKGALIVALDGVVVEQPQAIDPLAAVLSGTAPMREHRALDVVRAIEGAAEDDDVEAVVLDLERFVGGGQVHLSRIGEALDKVRAAKKPVLAYGMLLADDGMQLAAHADEVWLNPLGGAVVAGPGGSYLFYGDALDRLKVNMHVFKAGTYKAAVEPYSRSSFSPEAKEDLQARYDTLWEVWKSEVGKARPKAQIERMASEPAELVSAAGGDSAKASLSAGLVDKLGTREAFGERVAKIVGADPDDEEWPGSFAGTDYGVWLDANPVETPGKAIGVITIAGNIVDGEAGPGSAGGDTIANLLNDALDDDLAGLVVRVDSPGGSVFASEQIRQAILRHKAKGVPVVVSMANYAASGGYWVSTPADTIFAEPATMTGSIGVFGVVPTFENALPDWGIHADGLRTTPLSGQPDLVGGFPPELDRIMQGGVDNIYEQFLGLVGRSRNIPAERLVDLAEGRVWVGGPARQVGLVDRFGDLDDALVFAAKQAGLGEGDWHPEFLAAEPDQFEKFLASLTSSNREKGARVDLFSLASASQAALMSSIGQDAEVLFGKAGMQARCMDCGPLVRAPSPAPDPFWERLAWRLFARD